MTTAQLLRVPSARSIARLMTKKRNHQTKAETVMVAAIEAGAPTLADARILTDRFQAVDRGRAVLDLDPCITNTSPSQLASFARGLINDLVAVRDDRAVVEWSGRRPGQQAEARESSDVWPCPDRSAGSAASRCSMIVIESASDPILKAV